MLDIVYKTHSDYASQIKEPLLKEFLLNYSMILYNFYYT